jgi:hypothetical protein
MEHTPMTLKAFTQESNRRNGKVDTREFLEAELHKFTSANILGYHPNLGIYVKEGQQVLLYFYSCICNSFILFPAVNPVVLKEESK